MDNTAKLVDQDFLQKWEERLTALENDLVKQTAVIVQKFDEKSARLNQREAALNFEREQLDLMQYYVEECRAKIKHLDTAEANLQKRREQLEKDFAERAGRLAEQSEQLDRKEGELIEREADIKSKETSLEAENEAKFAAAQLEFLNQKQSEWETLAVQLEDERETYFRKLQRDLAQTRETRLKELEAECSARLNEVNSECESRRKELNRECETRLNALKAREDQFDLKELEQSQLEITLQREQRRLQNREAGLDELSANLDATMEDRFKDKLDDLKAQLSAKENAYDRLCEQLNFARQDAEQLKMIKAAFGDTPFDVMNKRLLNLEAENQNFREQIQTLAPKHTDEELNAKIEECNALLAERDELRKLVSSLRESAEKSDELASQVRRAKIELDAQNAELEILQKTNSTLHDRIKRLCSVEGIAAEREERIRAIEVKLPNVHAPSEEKMPTVDETEWLENIAKNCREYGFKIPRRILYAFHTALKIADWSTITMLSGASGTGKSELPQLYSKFGGLNFFSVSVQPNWDSQESLLGFFNSIDNKFDAQPLLRYLAQCGADDMSRSLNLVLLDDMNLAYVEQYFAEFLNKLELRRESEPPIIELNLGAGMEPYRLKLARNVLWTGTLNRGETSKPLSEKILDRGLIINLPRPKKLIGRSKLQSLDEFAKSRGVKMLDFRIWDEQWRKTELNWSEEQKKLLLHYREVIQQLNDCLAASGRALGYRVWQSIEFYAFNHPKVSSAMSEADGGVDEAFKKYVRLAVEDQLAQKIMPRLRGLETRGESYDDCLKKIRALLMNEGFGLDDDFALAEKFGFGYFDWTGAEYVRDDDDD